MRLLIICLLLAGCATGMTPEAKLAKGFDTVTAAANTTTRLLDTEMISSAQARRVLTIGTIADESLKAGEQRLTQCRAQGGTDCAAAVSEIDMGSGLLLEIERFLEAQEAN